jgi:hypothetical protein
MPLSRMDGRGAARAIPASCRSPLGRDAALRALTGRLPTRRAAYGRQPLSMAAQLAALLDSRRNQRSYAGSAPQTAFHSDAQQPPAQSLPPRADWMDCGPPLPPL